MELNNRARTILVLVFMVFNIAIFGVYWQDIRCLEKSDETTQQVLDDLNQAEIDLNEAQKSLLTGVLADPNRTREVRIRQYREYLAAVDKSSRLREDFMRVERKECL